MKFGVICATTAALFLSSAAIAKDLIQIPVNKDFYEGDIRIDDGFGVVYEFLFDVLLLENQIAVCGVGKFMDPATQSFTKGLMRKATITLNDKVILKNMGFFTKVKKRDDLATATANCKLTGLPAPKSRNNQINLNIGGGIFRY